MHRGCTKGSVFAERAEIGGAWVCLKGEGRGIVSGAGRGENEHTCVVCSFYRERS